MSNEQVEWHDVKRFYKIECQHCGYTIRCHTEKQSREIIDSHNFDTRREHWKFIMYRSEERPPPTYPRTVQSLSITFLDVKQEEIEK